MTVKATTALPIPMQVVGPMLMMTQEWQGEVRIPLATYETPLWPSVHRGALVSRQCGGIKAVIINDAMARSILLETPSVQRAVEIQATIVNQREAIAAVIAGTSRFARLQDLQFQIVGRLLYLRISVSTGDAAGHNMVTKAADALISWLLQAIPDLAYGSISANYCVDKKVSAVNGILGRGKCVSAELTIPEKICRNFLKTTPEKIYNLHHKKNLLGSILAGSVRSANAHFANMLLAFYLATGQDAANLVEGSQGIVHADMQDTALYFSVTLPNIIVGTVGNGKAGPMVEQNLVLLACTAAQPIGVNARKLALIAAGTVLCGELSLLAAQTNPGELMRSHERYERGDHG